MICTVGPGTNFVEFISKSTNFKIYDGDTAARVRVAVFVRSEKSNALVGDGVLQPAPRSANLDSAFGGMQLFATEAWRAAPLLLTHSAQLTQPTVRLPQL